MRSLHGGSVTTGRPARSAVAAALAGLVLAGCGSSTIEIVEVFADPTSTRLELSVDSCLADPTVEAKETDREVRLTVTGDEASGNDCLDSASVTLSKPLGDREVIDASTGESVQLSPPES